MQNKYTFKFGGTKMSCGCSNLGNDGKAVVDLVRSKGKADKRDRPFPYHACRKPRSQCAADLHRDSFRTAVEENFQR